MEKLDIAAWRKARGLSQAQLAKLLPVSVRTLQGWERGVPGRQPPDFLVRALADIEREMAFTSALARFNDRAAVCIERRY